MTLNPSLFVIFISFQRKRACFHSSSMHRTILHVHRIMILAYGVLLHLSIRVNDCIVVIPPQVCHADKIVISSIKHICSYLVSANVSNCSARMFNASLCPEIASTKSKPTSYIATLCTIESITSVSPQTGPVGTDIIIQGQIGLFMEVLSSIVFL